MGPSVTYRALYALLALTGVGCHFDRDLGEPAGTVATSGALETGSGDTAEPLGASETGGGQASTTAPGAADEAPEGDITCRDTLACTAGCVVNQAMGDIEVSLIDLFFSCLLECEADTVGEMVTTLQLVECATADCYARDQCEAVEGTGGGEEGGSSGSSTGDSSGSSTGGPGGELDPDTRCVNCLFSQLGHPNNLPADNACLEEAYACQ